MEIVKTINLKKYYKMDNYTVKAVDNINLNINNHEFIAIVGSSGSGKSTLLNIIAGKLKIKGKESPASNNYGSENYCQRFENECAYSLGSNEYGVPFYHLPENSRYIKSEDILYEIKKIQQKAILEHGLTYDYMQDGLSLEKAQSILDHKKEQRIENIIFSQEKYSNGETSLQFFSRIPYT